MNFTKINQIEREADFAFMEFMCNKATIILSKEREIYQRQSIPLSFLKKEMSITYAFLSKLLIQLHRKQIVSIQGKEGSISSSSSYDDLIVRISDVGLRTAKSLLYKSAI